MLHELRSSWKKNGRFSRIWPRCAVSKKDKTQSNKARKSKAYEPPAGAISPSTQPELNFRNQIMVLKNKKKRKILLRNNNVGEAEGEDSIKLSIANPALKHLSITFCELTECTVKISAPNLLTIFYRRCLPADFVLNGFPSLVEADVDCLIGEEYGNTNKVLKKADILLTGLPTFNNLILLEVTSGYSSSYFGSYSHSPDPTVTIVASPEISKDLQKQLKVGATP
ncbi:hypothetical protein C5167_041541 [Papaver somniferum]|nr:hypothetical protein C5167_041541 [Papaver somniferum]